MQQSRFALWLHALAEGHGAVKPLGPDLTEHVRSSWHGVSRILSSSHQQPASQVLFTRGAAKKPLRNDKYTTPPTNPVQLLQHIKLSRSFSRLQTVLKQHHDKLEPMHVSAAVSNLPRVVKHAAGEDARLNEKDWSMGGSLLAKLTHLAGPVIPQYQPRELANNLWAIGQVKKIFPSAVTPLQHALVQELASERYSKMFEGTNAIDVAQMVSGAERLGIKDVHFWGALERLATRRALEDENMTATHVATLAAAFAKAGHASKDLFAALAVRGRTVAGYFRPASAASTLSAYAKTNSAVANPVFMIDLLEVIQDQVGASRTEHLAQAVYAAATLQLQLSAAAQSAAWGGEVDGSTVSSSASPEAAEDSLPTLNSLQLRQQLLSSISSLAPLVAAESLRKLDKFSHNALVEMLLGLARLGYHDRALMDAVATGIAQEERIYADRKVMVGVIHAFTMLQHKCENTDGMLRKLCGVLKRGAEGMQPSLSLSLVKHLAELGYKDEPLLERIAESATRWPTGQQVELLEAMRMQKCTGGTNLLVEAMVQSLQSGGIEKLEGKTGYVMAELAQQGWKQDMGLYAALGGLLLNEGKQIAGVVVLRTFANLKHWEPAALMREAEAHIVANLDQLSGYWKVQAVAGLAEWPARSEQVVDNVLKQAMASLADCRQDDLLLLVKAAKTMDKADGSFLQVMRQAAETKQYRRLHAKL